MRDWRSPIFGAAVVMAGCPARSRRFLHRQDCGIIRNAPCAGGWFGPRLRNMKSSLSVPRFILIFRLKGQRFYLQIALWCSSNRSIPVARAPDVKSLRGGWPSRVCGIMMRVRCGWRAISIPNISRGLTLGTSWRWERSLVVGTLGRFEQRRLEHDIRYAQWKSGGRKRKNPAAGNPSRCVRERSSHACKSTA